MHACALIVHVLDFNVKETPQLSTERDKLHFGVAGHVPQAGRSSVLVLETILTTYHKLRYGQFDGKYLAALLSQL